VLSHLRSLAPMLIAIAILAAMALFIAFAPSSTVSKNITSHRIARTSTTMETSSSRSVASLTRSTASPRLALSSSGRSNLSRILAARLRRLVELGVVMQVLKLVSEKHRVSGVSVMESLVLTLPRLSLPTSIPTASVAGIHLRIRSEPIFLTSEQLKRALQPGTCSVLELPTEGYAYIDMFINRSSPSYIHEKVVLRYLVSVSTVYLNEMTNGSKTLITTFVAPVGLRIGALFISGTLRWAYMELGGVKTSVLLDYSRNVMIVVSHNSVKTVKGIPSIIESIARGLSVEGIHRVGQELVASIIIRAGGELNGERIGFNASLSMYLKEVAPGLYENVKTVYRSVEAYVARGGSIEYCLKLVHPYAATNSIEGGG